MYTSNLYKSFITTEAPLFSGSEEFENIYEERREGGHRVSFVDHYGDLSGDDISYSCYSNLSLNRILLNRKLQSE